MAVCRIGRKVSTAETKMGDVLGRRRVDVDRSTGECSYQVIAERDRTLRRAEPQQSFQPGRCLEAGLEVAWQATSNVAGTVWQPRHLRHGTSTSVKPSVRNHPATSFRSPRGSKPASSWPPALFDHLSWLNFPCSKVLGLGGVAKARCLRGALAAATWPALQGANERGAIG